ncbi:MAG: hypothetical protein ABIP48_17700 [Planctomycetota bacterium]
MNLKLNLDWLEKQPDRKGLLRDNHDRALNIMVGCFQTLGECNYRAAGWIDRRNGRRRRLENIRECYTTQAGKRALGQLLELTICALEAATWIDTMPVGALPTPKEPKRQTEAQTSQLLAASQKARQKREEYQARLDAARQARSGLGV